MTAEKKYSSMRLKSESPNGSDNFIELFVKSPLIKFSKNSKFNSASKLYDRPLNDFDRLDKNKISDCCKYGTI